MRRLKTLSWVLLALPTLGVGIWFTQDNSAAAAPILLGFALPELPLGVWLILFFLAGVLAALLATLPSLGAARARHWRLARDHARLKGARDHA